LPQPKDRDRDPGLSYRIERDQPITVRAPAFAIDVFTNFEQGLR
jgi:hypothetical protein